MCMASQQLKHSLLRRLQQTQTTALSWRCTWGSWTRRCRLRKALPQKPSGASSASSPWLPASWRCGLQSCMRVHKLALAVGQSKV